MPDPKSTDTSLPKLTPEGHQRTLDRIARIRGHLAERKRGDRLKGKVCVITGAGSPIGIGWATALLWAHEGATALYLVDFSPTHLPELKSKIQAAYPDVKVTTVVADAADEEAISALCKRALEEEGQLDVFFANAGIVSGGTVRTHIPSEIMNVFRVNTLSCFLAVKHASAAMEQPNPAKGKHEGRGSILMTASVAASRSGAGTADYSASKAAVNSLANSAAWQLSRTNIRVNSVCPGIIETGMTKMTFDLSRERGTISKMGQLNPTGRYGVPEEIAQVALFLASDESSYVNGQNIYVDGGLSASLPVVPGKWV